MLTKNNFFLILGCFLVYLESLCKLTSLLLHEGQIYMLIRMSYILLFILLIIFNTNKISIKWILITCFIAILSLINIILTNNLSYVVPVYFNFFTVYLGGSFFLGTEKLNFDTYLTYLNILAKFLTFLLPAYIFLYLGKYISYYDVGYVTHLNCLFLWYGYFTKEKSNSNLIFVIINLLVCLVMGSRSVFVTTLIELLITMIIFSKNKKIKFYLLVTIILGVGYYIYANLLSILINIQQISNKLGVNSRNLSLFISDLSNKQTVYDSGRDDIYPIVWDYLKKTSGLPNGVGITRFLTNGFYYHAHNFVLESLLTFGLVIGILILIFFGINYFIATKRYLSINNGRDGLLILFMTSFLIRSTVGTYFVQDSMFIFVFVMIIIRYDSNRLERVL
ncbi:O-antigen ligase family protein [Enterococcus sp. BWB1-3]|uniref:O-antigen ligase family protein n=1 Tax=Enterococcus sp. BWB1-3 TaxID=2787713 RepID=UPI001922054B|nr:O-antigen ligase family protein [Enterococcus sp. BWB1-3]MBL1228918.1 O-antigen ligase family protein [Enterococcus sp. BWB1-3]